MPGIKNILVTATSPEMKLVRFNAMECAGVICDAVGINIFAPDAVDLMTFFVQAIVCWISLYLPSFTDCPYRRQTRITSSLSTTPYLHAPALPKLSGTNSKLFCLW
jgi:hypothetical protein